MPGLGVAGGDVEYCCEEGVILSAHQPCYLPWLGLLAKIAAADLFCIFDGVPLSRHDYANRVQIKTQNGAQWLTVPVEHGRPLLKDARIVDGAWRRKHVRAIELAYSKAPHFQPYFDSLKVHYELGEFKRISHFDQWLLQWLLVAFDIKTPLVRASDYDFQGQKSDLVLDMCCNLGARTYIFGPNGRDYANLPAFEEQGIKVQFQDFQHPVYPQLHGEFVPGLSALDALMNLGPAARDLLHVKR